MCQLGPWNQEFDALQNTDLEELVGHGTVEVGDQSRDVAMNGPDGRLSVKPG